jgi:hypothetical protein
MMKVTNGSSLRQDLDNCFKLKRLGDEEFYNSLVQLLDNFNSDLAQQDSVKARQELEQFEDALQVWAESAYDHEIKRYKNGVPVHGTIGTEGSALCEMAWVLSAYGHVINPLQLNKWMNGKQYGDGGYGVGGEVNWDAIYDCSGGNLDAADYHNAHFGNEAYSNAPSILDGYLADGDLVIVEVCDPDPNANNPECWVVVEPEADGNYPIVDAKYSNTSNLNDYHNRFWSYVVVSMKSNGQ